MYSKQRCSVGRVQFHHISSTQHDILQCLINFLCCTQTCLKPTDSRYNKQMNRCFMCGTNLLPTTIPETKIAPENWWFEDYIPFEKRGTFSCAPLKLREGVAPSHPASSRLCMVLNSNCASWSSLSGSLPANGESQSYRLCIATKAQAYTMIMTREICIPLAHTASIYNLNLWISMNYH